ncbi:hypothetical protein CEXT_386401 [Caerostris extrusa]|uniref:Uncharacterized protein n=1 Tax=Caerostris extrusa TaxID=172846 RepID=A0AAV4W6J4_CAEEX|nr:hypothetical protein CEXT_386401 [Caerostris extrusa]
MKKKNCYVLLDLQGFTITVRLSKYFSMLTKVKMIMIDACSKSKCKQLLCDFLLGEPTIALLNCYGGKSFAPAMILLCFSWISEALGKCSFA